MADMTIGQHLLAEILPPDAYRPGQVIDKKSINQIFNQVAKAHPDQYRDISHRATLLGREATKMSGGGTFSIEDLDTPPEALARREVLKSEIRKILDLEPDYDRQDKAIISLLSAAAKTDKDDTVAELTKKDNPFATMLKGAGRGNPASVARLISSDLMYADAAGNPIPIPVLNSYSRGLTPAEYAASTFGVRKGVVEAKLNVGIGGYTAKTLLGAAHRMVVTDTDAPAELSALAIGRGLPVDVNDADNVGALLAVDTGPYKRNTVLTPKILEQLRKLKHDEILVRSPLTSVDPDGGVYARDVGLRENSRLPGIGEAVGVTAAGSIAEPLTQAMLSSKHKGGIAEDYGDGISGSELIDRLINTPKEFREAATHTEVDGKIEAITKAPQGGFYIAVAGHQYYAPANSVFNFKVGDEVEAGDQLTAGVANPRMVAKYKGIGEGGRQLVNSLRDAIGGAHRRNIELIVRGMMNRVRMTEELDDYSPDEVVPYDEIAARWKPREGYRTESPLRIKGKYLEQPVLHYSIGTRMSPSVVKMLRKHNVKQVLTHDNPPPFEPEVVRAVDLLRTDHDWMTRQIGTGLQKSLLGAAHQGLISDEDSTSFVPARARAVDFGEVGKVKLKVPPIPESSNIGY